MIRIALYILLPLVLPTLVYFGWMAMVARRPEMARAPWPWLVLTGAVLAVLSVGAMALTGGYEPGVEYIPPHLQDGRIVPGTAR